ncbi:unnamed protein product [Protopolystoma xenopodis]|uniref:Uncharacterized protein n=1 Tax=Protopolystoma xenopodis TaxID=117903 RepID=A0A448XSX3_9PLAT|nr:unnamed protein product [Protopolystoma xenopodis]
MLGQLVGPVEASRAHDTSSTGSLASRERLCSGLGTAALAPRRQLGYIRHGNMRG